MTTMLKTRLRNAKDVLGNVRGILDRQATTLDPAVDDLFRKIIEFDTDVAYWLELLEAREAAFQLLTGLEHEADDRDCVPLGKAKVEFRRARLIGVQAYIAMTWALVDRVTGLVGRIVCPVNSGGNPASPAQLVSHFVQMQKTDLPAALFSKSVALTFGWPIVISYAIRNHFIHDGAQYAGRDFFEGPSAAASFRISTDGWDRITTKVKKYGVTIDNLRCNDWPQDPQHDLRKVLFICEREIDDAVGVLVASACGALSFHVAAMLGEDC